jgi:hypothetical protein
MAISSLKLEIEGWKNESGITVANGLGQKLNKAYNGFTYSPLMQPFKTVNLGKL